MKTMKAAVLTSYHQPLMLRDVDLPTPGDGEVRLRVLAAGICSTDLHIREGKMPSIQPPHIQGHETVGEAETLGPHVENITLGKRYIVGIDIVCGKCRYCVSHRPNLCSNRERLGFERNGGFADYIIVPARNLVSCPPSIPVTQAAIVPDAVACMLHTFVDQAKIYAGQKIVLIGLGGLGFQGVQITRYFGASVIGTSRQKVKMDLGLKMGATAVCGPSEGEIKAQARQLWGEETADVIIDNIGTPETIATSLAICRPGGKVIVVGYDSLNVPLNLFDLMLNEKEVIGARGSTFGNLLQSMELIQSGAITPFVSDIYPFAEINTAMNDLEKGRILGRCVVTM